MPPISNTKIFILFSTNRISMNLKYEGMNIEDTYCEAFDGLFTRLIITARNRRYLERAAHGSSCLPSTVVGRTEGGIEKWLPGEETPDGRPGAIVQIWGNAGGKKAVENFKYELSLRIRQGILVVPTTRVFNHWDSEEKIGTLEGIGHCGDGYEWFEERYGRKMINVPLMMGEFLIEYELSLGRGIAGGNIWYYCRDEETALDVGEKAVSAVEKINGAVTTFDICSAGSKVETNYPEIGPTTNHPYCPTLVGKIKGSRVPSGVGSIPEIVINAVDMESLEKAMRACVDAARGMDGVRGVSAGNYGGKLGKYHIYLKDLLNI